MRSQVAHSVQTLGYGLDNKVQFLAETMMGFLSLCHHIQTGSGAHPASYSVGTWGSYPWGK